MRTTIAAILLLTTSVAIAQPGADPRQPQPYPPPPQQPYPQQPMYPQQPPPPYYGNPGYGPAIQLSPEEQELLARGEISDGEHIAGAALAIFIGFGVGQAVEGRWGERGWIFTLGEIGTISLMFYGLASLVGSSCNNTTQQGLSCQDNNTTGEGPFIAGLIGYGVFRLWDVIDSITGPAEHNERVRALRIRTGYSPMGAYGRIQPFVGPGAHDQGMAAGITIRF